MVFIVSLLGQAAVPAWVYDSPLTVRFPFDSVAQMTGMGLWSVGGALVIWSMRTLGRFTRAEIEVRADHRLVSDGPYRWIRHPIYLALLMMAAGVALFLLISALMALAILAFAIARRRASSGFLGRGTVGLGRRPRAHLPALHGDHEAVLAPLPNESPRRELRRRPGGHAARRARRSLFGVGEGAVNG